ncbi:MAG: adenylate/guanylate cyclase domain-containing protein [Verrucomicrobiota bacterium]
MTSSPSDNKWMRAGVALLAVALAYLALGVFPHGKALVARMDRAIHDQLVRYTGGPPEREDFVLLGIDDASLSLDGISEKEIAASEVLPMMQRRFPWDRRVWAATIDRLAEAGAKLIVVDLLFLEPSDPAADDALAAAIARHPEKVVLPSLLGPVGQRFDGGYVFTLKEPYVQFLESEPEPRIGYVNFTKDSIDGSFRVARYRTTLGKENGEPLNGEPEFLSLAGQVIAALGGEVPNGDRELNFTKRSKTWGTEVYAPLSLREIFVDELWRSNYDSGGFFKDKVVMIGPVASRFQDIKETPVGPLTGPQLHLQAASCGMSKAFIRSGGSPAGMLIGLGLLGVLWAGWTRRPWVSGLGMAVIIVLTFVVAGWFVFSRSIALAVMGGVIAAVVGWMSAMVYQLVRERVEKGRLRREFRRFVSRDVADRLVDDPEAWREIAGGRKRKVVVLFSDVRGFTSRSELSDPADLVVQLNEYLTAMVAVVFKHGGTLDKFIGDAVMAHWGALDDDDEGRHARAALAAAREMGEELARLNEAWIWQGRPTFEIGIGIHQGDAVAGELGSPERIEFGVIGDAVNLASRLEGLTKVFACEVVFSSQVREAVGDLEGLDLGRVRVKGREASVQLYGLGERASVEKALATLERDQDGVVVMTSK